MAKQQSDSSYEGMVAVFELMLTFLTYMGAGYNPGPAHLKLPALQARLASLKSLLNDVSAAKAAYDAAIANRAALVRAAARPGDARGEYAQGAQPQVAGDEGGQVAGEQAARAAADRRADEP